MIYRFTLLFLLLSLTSPAQQCNDHLGTTTDGSGTAIFAFKETINISAAKGKTGISIYGCIVDSTLVVIFGVAGKDPCIRQGTDIHATFTDGTRMELLNLQPDNCEQKSMTYFSRELNNRGQFDTLKNKQIKTLKIWTSPSEFVKVDIPAQTALKLSESLKCLSDYLGAKPPAVVGSVSASADMNKQTDPADTVKQYVPIEQQPEYVGGYEALLRFIMDNLKTPPSADKDKLSGTVIVTFIVDRDGSVKEAAIAQGIREDLNAEALRVVNLMPNWIPAKHHGKPVAVRFNLPVRFRR